MGFRSTFVTQDWSIVWPEWFIEKYKEAIWFNDDRSGPIASKKEYKLHGFLGNLAEDIQKAIDWNDFHDGFEFCFVWLHEDYRITRAIIKRDAISYDEPEPDSWMSVDEPRTY